jgi:hypothetical protein
VIDVEGEKGEDLAYNEIELVEKLSRPKTEYLTEDVSTSFLKEDEGQIVRTALPLIMLLDSKGFVTARQMIVDLIGAFAVVTKGMGNQAALIAKQAYWYWNIKERSEEGANIMEYLDKLGGYFR